VPRWSLIGLHSPAAISAARANAPSLAVWPASDASAFCARTGVGATAPRAMRALSIRPPSPSVTTAATPTTGTLAATHAFADDASLSVAVQICDDDGGCGTAVVAVTVANVAPTVEAGPDRVVDEGTLLDLAVSFQDPGFDNPAAGTVEDFSAFVNWGEGFGVQAPMTVLETPGSAGTATTGSASASHVYADDGAYLVTVTVRDDDGGYGTDVFLVTVRNVAPTVDPAPDLSIAEGGAAVTVALALVMALDTR